MSRKRLLIISLAIVAALVVAAGVVAIVLLTPAYKAEEGEAIIIVYPDSLSPNPEGYDVRTELEEKGVRTTGFRLLQRMGLGPRVGMYAVRGGDNILAIAKRMHQGRQVPLSITLPSLRTMDDLAGFLGRHLLMDSTEVARSLGDSAYVSQYGYTKETLPALFIPNTYEVYWNTSLDAFMQRMLRENSNFWTTERDSLAREAGLTHTEVATLASIVDEETANNGEKPMIAGMYINRLRVGMPLQADPTVKYALGDFALRRLLRTHLEVDNPYNTYRNEGLPPGPIRIPTVSSLEAVLHHVSHDYLYMCAKEDFSGTHNFAATYPEHLRNAHRYQRALNARGIR